uniref:NADH dehydrogenase subunit 6 n=1 Tax=Linguatula serrata TaxID=646052 RepID=A0A385UKQ6_9CRUS|nr:NADH dehydrogenase subunit 6 [Linguatula serrata]AYB71164.1 NADH dehydrogenase subunit 6 [Linguatula serrata]
MFTLLLMNSLMFISSISPLIMSLSLIAQTLLISLSLNFLLQMPCFPIIITLILAGSMMIIFLYLSSLTPNEKTHLHLSKLLLLSPLLLFPLPSMPHPHLPPSPPTLSTSLPFLTSTLLLMSIIIITLMSSSLTLTNSKSPMRLFKN